MLGIPASVDAAVLGWHDINPFDTQTKAVELLKHRPETTITPPLYSQQVLHHARLLQQHALSLDVSNNHLSLSALVNEEPMYPEFLEVTEAEHLQLSATWLKHPVGQPPLNAGQRAVARELVFALRLKRVCRAANLDPGQAATIVAAELASEYDQHAFTASYTTWLLLGEAGTGKTKMLQVLEEVMTREGLGSIVFVAFTGVAATGLPHGATVCSMSGMSPAVCRIDTVAGVPEPDSMHRTSFRAIAGPPAHVALLVLDEISFNGAALLGNLSQRFGQLLENRDHPWGGALCLMPGDFLQLGPVAGTPLYTEAIRQVLTKLPGKKAWKRPKALTSRCRGTELLLSARRLVLVQQMRAAQDKVWASWMTSMRDLHSTQPISDELIAFLADKVITQKDRASEKWLFARGGGVAQVSTRTDPCTTHMNYSRPNTSCVAHTAMLYSATQTPFCGICHRRNALHTTTCISTSLQSTLAKWLSAGRLTLPVRSHHSGVNMTGNS